MFRRVLVANRGAIARRVIRACDALAIETVAVFSEADRPAPYLEEATYAEALKGVTAKDTYLNQAALIAIAKQAGCDAVHPGYGFLAENADFVDALTAQDIAFVGPSARHIRDLGDKVAARAMFADQNFPMHSGSQLVASLADARKAADALGYPLLMKPSLGGGGIGMVLVNHADELETAFGRARAVSESAFGRAEIYLERFVERARHIEFQMLADRQGNVMHLYERDCSVQRRHQKVIEEAPAPLVDRSAVTLVAEQAESALSAMGYDNVGTVETLLDQQGAYGFLEVNTRIQVEHAVSEAVTGIDIVAEQIQLAAGGDLPVRPELQGHAVEVRIYAEDPRTHAPSTGRLETFRPPDLHGVRVETGYAQGQFVTPYYDPMLAKVIAHAEHRPLAIGRALVALKAFEIAGVQTNIPLLMAVLQNAAFVQGDVHTRFLSS